MQCGLWVGAACIAALACNSSQEVHQPLMTVTQQVDHCPLLPGMCSVSISHVHALCCWFSFCPSDVSYACSTPGTGKQHPRRHLGPATKMWCAAVSMSGSCSGGWLHDGLSCSLGLCCSQAEPCGRDRVLALLLMHGRPIRSAILRGHIMVAILVVQGFLEADVPGEPSPAL